MAKQGGPTRCEKCGEVCAAGSRSGSGVVYTCQGCGYMFRRMGRVNTPYTPLSGWQTINRPKAKPKAPRSEIRLWIQEQGFNARVGEPFVGWEQWRGEREN